MNLLKKIFKKEYTAGVESLQVPKGWYVQEAGQNPLFMLWFIVILNLDDVKNNVTKPRYVIAEECDTFEEAMLTLILILVPLKMISNFN